MHNANTESKGCEHRCIKIMNTNSALKNNTYIKNLNNFFILLTGWPAIALSIVCKKLLPFCLFGPQLKVNIDYLLLNVELIG